MMSICALNDNQCSSIRVFGVKYYPITLIIRIQASIRIHTSIDIPVLCVWCEVLFNCIYHIKVLVSNRIFQ